MIERNGDVTEVSCDGCTEQLEVDGDFNDAVTELKELGWKMKRDKAGGWTHNCPDCTETEHKVASDQDGGGMPDETW